MTGTTHYDSPRTEMLRFVPAGARRVLDVGCGGGGFGRSLQSESTQRQVWGIEPDAGPARQAAASGGYERVAVGAFPDGLQQLGTRTYDVIFFNDVLEHMTRPEDALAAAHGLLGESGTLVASIPNVRHFSVIWPLVRRGEWHYEDSGILDRTHVRFFTPRTMRELFEDAGWTVRAMTGINRARWPMGGVDTWKTRLLSRLTFARSDSFFFTQYVIEATSAGPLRGQPPWPE